METNRLGFHRVEFEVSIVIWPDSALFKIISIHGVGLSKGRMFKQHCERRNVVSFISSSANIIMKNIRMSTIVKKYILLNSVV